MILRPALDAAPNEARHAPHAPNCLYSRHFGDIEAARKAVHTLVMECALCPTGYCKDRHHQPSRPMNRQELFKREQSHPFFANPRKWLHDNADALHDSFGPPTVIACMDPGVFPAPGQYGIFAAGAGLLDPDADGHEAAALDLGVTTRLMHDNCGACKEHARRTDIGKKHPDDAGEEWARNRGRFSVERLRLNRMIRPKNMYPALAAYYIGAHKGFDPRPARAPVGFKVSRSITSEKHGMEQLAMAGRIAFSDHGLAAIAPHFHFIPLGGSDRYPHEQLVAEAEEVAQRLNAEFHTDIFKVVAAELPI